jgi:hypothetical protein
MSGMLSVAVPLTLTPVRRPSDVLEAAFRRFGAPFDVYVVLPKDAALTRASMKDAWPALAAALVLFGCRSFWICGVGGAEWETMCDDAIIRLAVAAKARPELYGVEPFKVGGTVSTAVSDFDDAMLMAGLQIDADDEVAERLVLIFDKKDVAKVRQAILG